MTKYLRTKNIPVEELTPYPGNARRGDVAKIAESLEKNGQYRSLIVRQVPEGHVVLAGNHTLMALKKIGNSAARCEVIECDDQTALRINLADNRTAELGDYDEDLLADLLRGLDDPEGTGYDEDDLARFFVEPSSPVEGPTDFPEYDEKIEVEHTCPKCGYEWSGGK